MPLSCVFPRHFLWGCAASSYQIEGAPEEDGKGPSIWDEFCKLPGRIRDGSTGRTACDHYHRYLEDLDLMKQIGIRAYRFSVSWPRVFPQGRGRINEKGLDFYDRLVDAALERGIEPMATCYHWDLPQALEDEGGWRKRQIVRDFEGYCRALAKRLGDRVRMWCTINEPWCVFGMGYQSGEIAPGAREPEQVIRQITHHILLAHGAGVRAIHESAPKPARVGIVHNNHIGTPFFETPEDIAACREDFAEFNDWMLLPTFKGMYPEKQWKELGKNVPVVKKGDMELIAEPGDFLGLNVYTSAGMIRAGEARKPFESWFPKTDFGWPILPDSLYWSVRFTAERYAPREIYITENGCCWPDTVNKEGRVEDYARIEYLRGHLRGLQRAAREKYPVKGYFLWSILDNFEWAQGFTKRFGIVHVNFETLKRTPKASAEWYAKVIANNGF